MLEVHCSGTPYEIGHQHGQAATDKVESSLAFYQHLFRTTCSMDWKAVCQEAQKYMEPLNKNCPEYVEEMQGLADGAGVPLVDIVALNVRTEITFGLFTLGQPTPPTDGCTSLAYKLPGCDSVLAQNWDWQKEQSDSLLICHVSHRGFGKPDFVMITEGGIIGKIGFNSRGVGVCQNAIRAYGIDTARLPVHLAMRAVLESASRQEAIELLHSRGIAGSVHLLVGDATGSTGLECTSIGVKEIPVDHEGKVVHANHLILDHPEVDEPPWLDDSPDRTRRMEKLLVKNLRKSACLDDVGELFKDEQGYPASINRRQIGGSETQTLFTILMNLSLKTALVTFGRPTEPNERVQLKLA